MNIFENLKIKIFRKSENLTNFFRFFKNFVFFKCEKAIISAANAPIGFKIAEDTVPVVFHERLYTISDSGLARKVIPLAISPNLVKIQVQNSKGFLCIWGSRSGFWRIFAESRGNLVGSRASDGVVGTTGHREHQK